MNLTAAFKPIVRKEGDLIESKDWNAIQIGLLDEIERLRQELYNMSESLVFTGLESRVGRSYSLDEKVSNESVTYGEKTIGLITRQWLTLVPGEGEICSFGIMESFDQLYYWAGAADGDKNTLDITIEYLGGEPQVVGKNLYINERRGPPSDPAQDNPWLIAVRSVNDLYWYKYKIDNPFPDRQVVYVNFINKKRDCVPRIGNVIHLKSKLRPMTPR